MPLQRDLQLRRRSGLKPALRSKLSHYRRLVGEFFKRTGQISVKIYVSSVSVAGSFHVFVFRPRLKLWKKKNVFTD